MYSNSIKARTLFEDGVFYIWAIHGGTEISQDTIDAIREQPDIAVVQERIDTVLVSSGKQRTNARVSYTDENYINSVRMIIIDGGFITPLRDNTIAISDTLAWKLFGSYNVSGLHVIINEREYEIVGVVRLQSGEEYAWLLPGASNAGGLYFGPRPYDKINSYRLSQEMLIQSGISIWDYSITDINEYTLSIMRRVIFSLSILGVLTVFFLVCYAWIKKHVVKSTIAVIVAVGIIPFLNFKMWIPGFNGYGSFLGTFMNIGKLPTTGFLSPSLTMLSDLNTTVNILFVVSLIILVITGVILVTTYEKN